jgi:predicted metalloprotease
VSNAPASNDRETQFVGAVLRDVQETWDRRLPESGKNYRHAKLVLFRDSIASACGQARSATGPFYCPGDEKVYVDLGFFDELKTRFGAPGEFAQAYVLAHEIGHHVQKILGIEAQVERAEQRNPGMQNQYSVRVELQADCFAGVWASHPTEVKLDSNDIEAGLRAAAAVGDDRLQKMARGTVSPESFTHGSSAQRMHWFRTGYQNGTVASCDTFSQR